MSNRRHQFGNLLQLAALVLVGMSCGPTKRKQIEGAGEGNSSVLANASSLAQDPDAKLWGVLTFKLNCKNQEVSSKASATELATDGNIQFDGFKNLADGDTCTMQVSSSEMKKVIDRNEATLQGTQQSGEDVIIFNSAASKLTKNQDAAKSFSLAIGLKRMYTLNNGKSLVAKLSYAATEKARIGSGSTLDATLNCDQKTYQVATSTLANQTSDSIISLTFLNVSMETAKVTCFITLTEKNGNKQLSWSTKKVSVENLKSPITFELALVAGTEDGSVNVTINEIVDSTRNDDRKPVQPVTDKVAWGIHSTSLPGSLVGNWGSTGNAGIYTFTGQTTNSSASVTFPQDVASKILEVGIVTIGNVSYRYFKRAYDATPTTAMYCMYHQETTSTLQFACGSAKPSGEKELAVRNAAEVYKNESGKLVKLVKKQ